MSSGPSLGGSGLKAESNLYKTVLDAVDRHENFENRQTTHQGSVPCAGRGYSAEEIRIRRGRSRDDGRLESKIHSRPLAGSFGNKGHIGRWCAHGRVCPAYLHHASRGGLGLFRAASGTV